MSLVRVNLPEAFPPAPAAVARFLADAKSRVESFIESRRAQPVRSFVPSDFPLVYGALRHVADEHLAVGRAFCEWGSGAGAVACLAARVGFVACGIEVEADLVDLSIELARDHRLTVDFCRGNFVPQSGQEIADEVDEFGALAAGGPDAYETMGLEIDDFDVVFAYPWPGEQRVIERLFERFAANGALLMTYNGAEGVRLFRRQAERPDE